MINNKNLMWYLAAAALLVGLIIIVASPGMSAAEKAAIPIVEKNVTARGGLEAWRAINSMSMSGQMEAGKVRSYEAIRNALERGHSKPKALKIEPGIQKNTVQDENIARLPYLLELQRPRKMRLELDFHGQTAIQVYDGSQGWKLRPFLGRHEVETFTPEELKLASQQQDLDGPLIDYRQKDSRVELEGGEAVEGHDAYKLKVTLKDGTVRHVWIDKKTYLDLKIDGTRRVDGKPRPVSTYLRDYKSVNGLQIPHTLETSVEGIPGSEKILVDKVILNAKIDDSRFAKPN